MKRSNIEWHVEFCLKSKEATQPINEEPSPTQEPNTKEPSENLEAKCTLSKPGNDQAQRDTRQPLADRMRPTSFAELQVTINLRGES